MGRYSKLNSSYILRKQHQTIDGGVILERDWTTIGERSNINKGKKRVFYDGNFLFTENTESMGYRKALSGRWVGSFNYDDVKDASDVVNKVKLNTTTNNPLVFSYYGSLYDKYEGALINIIKEFPGKIVFGDILFQPGIKDYSFPDNLSELKNDFEINLITAPTNLEAYENRMRYMELSWQNYVISVNGIEKPITKYTVKNKQNDIWDVQRIYTGTGELYKYNDKYYKYDKSTGQYIDIDIVESDNYFVKCNEYIKHKDSYYKWSDEKHMYKELPIEKVCEPKVYEMFEVTFFSGEEEYKIHIYRNHKWINYTNEMYYDENGNLLSIEIKPKKEIVEKYFSGLTGVEANMLTRKSNPNYSFNIITCTKNDFGNVVKQVKILSWPKNDDYTIKVNGLQFDMFVDELLTSAELYDENFSDNIWRNMTHESIKNYDWSYEIGGEENDLLENEIGSNKVSSILRLIGMQFDEIKLYVDGITASNKLTYDGFLNMPDSEIVNELEISGFDTYSTIWHQDEYIPINENDIPENTVINNYFTVPNTENILDDYISVGCEEGESGIQYYKRVSTLGNEVRLDYAFFDTENETVVGKKNPWIKENYSGYSYKRISYVPSVLNQYWNERNTFDSVPTIGTRFSPKYIRVNDVDRYEYYEKVQSFDSENFIHKNWYEKIDPNYFTQSIVDIDFMKRLGLSAKNMFATKGTAHSIDMIMGVFGFGRENDLQNSDYQIIEPYHQLNARQTDEEFYYYEPLENAPSGVTYGTNATFLTLPLHANSNNSMFPENIRVDDGSNGYYYFVKKHSKIIDAATRIFSKIIPVTYDGKRFSGFPLSTTVINEKEYLIPYMSDKYSFYGDVYFQSKGGWCKNSGINSGKYDYLETVPYIKSTNSVNGLISIDNDSISVGDYVYVKYPLYQSEDFGVNPDHVSNYFKLVSSDVTDPHSWRNIPISGPIEFDNYIPITDDQFEPTHEDYLNVKFIDEIVFTNKGNNPHCGNGQYDGGDEYISYMKLPFKYATENPETMFSDNVALCIAKQFVFNVSSFKYDFVKSYCHNNVFTYENLETEPNVNDTYWSSQNTFVSVPIDIYASSPELIRIKQSDDTYKFYKRVKLADAIEPYFLNSKVVIMRNLLNSVLYKKYFNSIIRPYLLQLIPSTTIFVFENFNECEVNNGVSYNISIAACPEEGGTVSGGGTYFECDNARLIASPNQGYHFVRWELISCENDDQCDIQEVIETEMGLSTETITPKVVDDGCYRAIFEGNCEITFGNIVTICNNTTEEATPFGRIMHNGLSTIMLGEIYNIDNENESFYFISEPNAGYNSNSWCVFDEENLDITTNLINSGAIGIDYEEMNRFDVYKKEELCGCKICAKYIPIMVDIDAQIECNCDESGCEITTNEICNPVTITFNAPSVHCKDNIVFLVSAPGIINAKKYHNDTLTLSVGSIVHITLSTENSQCCTPYTMYLDGDNLNVTSYSFTVNADCTIAGYASNGEVNLTYEYGCCDFAMNTKFYSKTDPNKTPKNKIQCGQNPVLEIGGLCNFIPNVQANGQVIDVRWDETYEVYYYEFGPVYNNIHAVITYNYNNFVEFSHPVENISGTFVKSDVGNCFQAKLKSECDELCEKLKFSFDFTGDCDCRCGYSFTGEWAALIDGGYVQFNVDQNGTITLAKFLDFVGNNYTNCDKPTICPVVSKIAPIISIGYTDCDGVSIQFYNDNFELVAILNKNETSFMPQVEEYYINYVASDCCNVESVTTDNECVAFEYDNALKMYHLIGLCGNVKLTINTKKIDKFNVSVNFYNANDNTKIDVNPCFVAVTDNYTYVGSFIEQVSCGSNFKVDARIIEGCCCDSIEKVVLVSNGEQMLYPISQEAVQSITINNITSDYEVRVFISLKTYYINIVFDAVSDECGIEDPEKCITIKCLGSYECTEKLCKYQCGQYVSFTKNNFCGPGSECCDKIVTVHTGDGKAYQFGALTNYNPNNKTWYDTQYVTMSDDISQIVCNEIIENMVLLVKYDCTDGGGTDYGNLTLTPVQEIDGEYRLIDENTPCLIYSQVEDKTTKACTFGYELRAESNDCFRFKEWREMVTSDEINFVDNSNTLYVGACSDTTIYGVFESIGSESHRVSVTMATFEHDFSQFNPNMHNGNNELISSLNDTVMQVRNGSCGVELDFQFTNTSPQYFSFLGIYKYDSFNLTYIPCNDIDVEIEEGNGEEIYKFKIASCESVDYFLVLIPNDYITFYNTKYFSNVFSNINLTYGFYNGATPVINYDQVYRPNITFWDKYSGTWRSFVYDAFSGLFDLPNNANVVNFLMLRIETKIKDDKRLGNFCLDSQNNRCMSKFKIYIDGVQSQDYGICGSILSLCYGKDGAERKGLPDYFLGTAFTSSKPEYISGHIFKNVTEVGENGLYATFQNTRSDFIMMGNVSKICDNGCKQAFCGCALSGVSFDNLEVIENLGCQEMFLNSDGIYNDLYFPNLRSVGNYGCESMFKNADGSSQSLYQRPGYQMNVAFGNLENVGTESFKGMFFGCSRMQMTLSITGSAINLNASFRAFKQAFDSSGIVSADLSSINIITQARSQLESCFNNCPNLQSVVISNTFMFMSPSTSANPTNGWLNQNQNHGTLFCSDACKNSVEINSWRGVSTVPTNWTITVNQ